MICRSCDYRLKPHAPNRIGRHSWQARGQGRKGAGFERGSGIPHYSKSITAMSRPVSQDRQNNLAKGNIEGSNLDTLFSAFKCLVLRFDRMPRRSTGRRSETSRLRNQSVYRHCNAMLVRHDDRTMSLIRRAAFVAWPFHQLPTHIQQGPSRCRY